VTAGLFKFGPPNANPTVDVYYLTSGQRETQDAMSRTKGSKPLGKFLFFIPVAAVLVLVILAIVSLISTQTGTLVVRAESSNRYSPTVQLYPSVAVGANDERSPFNFSLSQGTYTVVYGPLSWYVTPPSRSIVLSGGRTEFAVAVYSPVIRSIAVTQNGFNSTSITAMHGVTPVVWINERNSTVVLEISGVRATIAPSENYTRVFPSAGRETFDILNSESSGTVDSL
jgi:hypothetical protein